MKVEQGTTVVTTPIEHVNFGTAVRLTGDEDLYILSSAPEASDRLVLGAKVVG